jgi:hypothetical protein
MIEDFPDVVDAASASISSLLGASEDGGLISSMGVAAFEGG